mmetsp:Transcript_11885/g.27863  ORF Transcript_11885/g.27863 Transcript_11885/m.27863 type:complete len:290 (+) Transcript_11885:183-1052(+)|eukprot:CAMPEP_0172624902 /NCGR_PEP_ID=MMETSP1068-20121228/140064_1 /TAXON_ID=35684 /ORGANISM="Pseudopedinella elastica, Strain CCMP716" /LENGTH=289 /DNA_ID=CAMNT_0013434021 /DNA_START=207 /DNA_END=1076 /DNA_ORIENTATION=-
MKPTGFCCTKREMPLQSNDGSLEPIRSLNKFTEGFGAELIIHTLPTVAIFSCVGLMVTRPSSTNSQLFEYGVICLFLSLVLRLIFVSLWLSPTRKETDCGIKPHEKGAIGVCCCTNDTFLLMIPVGVCYIASRVFRAPISCLCFPPTLLCEGFFCSQEFGASVTERNFFEALGYSSRVRACWYQVFGGTRFLFWVANASEDDRVRNFASEVLRTGGIAEACAQHTGVILVASSFQLSALSTTCIALSGLSLVVESVALIRAQSKNLDTLQDKRITDEDEDGASLEAPRI